MRTHVELGRLLRAAGKKQEAEAAFGQAVSIQKKLEAEYGQKADYRQDLALSHATAAQLLNAAGRNENVGKLCRLTLSHLEPLAEEFAGDPEQQRKVAHLCYDIGERLPKSPEEEKAFQLAAKLFGRVLAHAPTDAPAREMLGHSYRRVAFIARVTTSRLQEAEGHFRLAAATLRRTSCRVPGRQTLP